MLAWDCGAVEDLSSLAQALKGQQSEYGGDLFDRLADADEDTVEFDTALQRYAQIIHGERFEPAEKHLRAFIAAANQRSF